MSRAALQARKDAKKAAARAARVDAGFAEIEAIGRIDGAGTSPYLVACDECGLEVVYPAQIVSHPDIWVSPCVVCGCETCSVVMCIV